MATTRVATPGTGYALGTHTHRPQETPPHSNGAKAHTRQVTLTQAGADPTAEDADGASPLQYALSQSGHARAADALLRSSASAGPSEVESELLIEDYFCT